MTPKEYLDRYTYFKFLDSSTNLVTSIQIKGYGSGWPHRGGKEDGGVAMQKEYQQLKTALQVMLFGKPNKALPAEFWFQDEPWGPFFNGERFYQLNLINVFNGNGSPDEIWDLMRLASAAGRFGDQKKDAAGYTPAAMNAQIYADKFLTLDCNGLVGNYHGLHGHISVYANKAAARKSVADVRVGDCLVTHCPTSKYEHVALIAEWAPFGTGQAQVAVVEWGTAGGEEKHYKPATLRTISQGPESSFGIGWPAQSFTDVASFRYIFAPPVAGTGMKGYW
jgi:hypothetical protein